MSTKQSRTSMPISPHIIDAAAEWFVAMREPNVSAAQSERFADWLRASPQHVHAYLDIASVWNDAPHANIDTGDAAAVSEAGADVVSLQADRSTAAEVAEPKRERRILPTRLAASFIVAALATAGAWWYSNRPMEYAAEIGEQRVITLEDGSILRLNSRSRARVRFSESRRELDLIEGQGLFDVAKDAQRPFVVRSGAASVQAVGTSFDVYLKPQGTIVTVVEGRVIVLSEAARSDQSNKAPATPSSDPDLGSRPGPDAAVPVALSAGEQATVDTTGFIQRQTNVNVTAAVSWRDHVLMFENEPLSTVVEEFNRYSRRTIVVSDPQLAAYRVNAVFHSTSPEPLLRYVRKLDDGIAIEDSGSSIRISRVRERQH